MARYQYPSVSDPEARKRHKRKYVSERPPNSPQPPIATIGKYPGRAGQPSAEAKGAGEMYGPYRGPFNDPKYHTRGEPVNTIMNMERFPSLGKNAGNPAYSPGTRDMSRAPTQDRMGTRAGTYPPPLEQMQELGQAVRKGLTPPYYKGPPGMQASPRTVAEMKSFFSRPEQTPVNPANEPVAPFDTSRFLRPINAAKQAGPEIMQGARKVLDWGLAAQRALGPESPAPTATGPLGMNRNDTIQPTGTVGTRAGTASGTPPGQDFETAWAKYYKDNPPVGGKPDIFYGPGEARAMPGGGGPTPPPTHIIKGNAEGYKDWNTGQTFGTFDEAVRGEVSAETKARAAKAAEQAFELQKIVTEQAAKGGEIKWREGDQQIVDGEMVSTGGEYYDTKKGPLRGTQGGSVGLQNFQPALAAAGTNADIIDALINGTFPDAQSRIKAYEMLSKEQIEAMREKRKGKRQK